MLKTYENDFPFTTSFSPDGRYLAYDFPQEAGSQNRDILVVPVTGGQERTLIRHPANDYLLGWAPDGEHVLFASDRSGTPGAWLLPVADGKPSGSPWLVRADMWRAIPVGFTADGRYFYGVRTGSREVYIATFDSETGTVIGSPTAVNSRPLTDSRNPHWSPDGRHLAYVSERGPAVAMGSAASSYSIVIHSLETGEVRQLERSPFGNVMDIRWRSDGRALLVEASRWGDPEDRGTLFELDLRTNQTRVLLRWEKDRRAYDHTVSADGRSVFYWDAIEDAEGRTAFRIVREDLSTGEASELLRTPYGGWGQVQDLQLSPDGETLAVALWPTGEAHRLVLLPVAGGEPRELMRAGVGGVAWMPDRSALLIQRAPDEPSEELIWELWYVPLAGGEPKPTSLTAQGVPHGLDVRPDGRQVAFVAGVPGAELWVMENFLPTATPAKEPGSLR